MEASQVAVVAVQVSPVGVEVPVAVQAVAVVMKALEDEALGLVVVQVAVVEPGALEAVQAVVDQARAASVAVMMMTLTTIPTNAGKRILLLSAL